MKSLIVGVMVVAMMVNLVVEGLDLPVCVVSLVGCADYLNTTTTPPATCCVPLKEAVTDQLPCLCDIYNDPALLQSFGINVTQAIELPGRCGINFSISECTGSPAPNSPIPQPGSPTPNFQTTVNSPTTLNSPTTPSAPPPSSDTGRSATATFSCLFILAAAMLY
ncbi:lipid transfer-like protein VAS [Heracleum sosnowskyi]|uniref:Lipid transfer-like protein VAS n=1 Tax=Heracleum sosnowskyi TaxID=360622 RepID=A0AAD8I0T4_9APIA|nr:lipid transfer-like protein VAS [Heracleum sosnowskyi]